MALLVPNVVAITAKSLMVLTVCDTMQAISNFFHCVLYTGMILIDSINLTGLLWLETQYIDSWKFESHSILNDNIGIWLSYFIIETGHTLLPGPPMREVNAEILRRKETVY